MELPPNGEGCAPWPNGNEPVAGAPKVNPEDCGRSGVPTAGAVPKVGTAEGVPNTGAAIGVPFVAAPSVAGLANGLPKGDAAPLAPANGLDGMPPLAPKLNEKLGPAVGVPKGLGGPAPSLLVLVDGVVPKAVPEPKRLVPGVVLPTLGKIGLEGGTPLGVVVAVPKGLTFASRSGLVSILSGDDSLAGGVLGLLPSAGVVVAPGVVGACPLSV